MRNFAQSILPTRAKGRVKGETLSSRRSAAAFLSLILVGVLALFITSCSGRDPQDTLSAAGEVAKKQQELFWIIFAWATLVFVLVEGVLLFVLVRFRRRSESEMPAQTHGNNRLEIAWTVAPALILIFIAIPTVASIFDLAKEHDVSMRVKVIGHQWWWEFQYPGLGVVTANELHIPVGEVVAFDLESADVIHSFWVPKLAGKQDAVPGRSNPLWVKADAPGTYLGQCAELCGIQHAQMRLRIVVQEKAQFDQWVKDQRTPVSAPGAPALVKGSQIVQQKCAACHTVQGLAGAVGKVGPTLTHIGGRGTIASGVLNNTPENLARWIRDPQEVKRGALMPALGLSEDEIQAVVPYLQSLK